MLSFVAERTLKADALGRVELGTWQGQPAVQRVTARGVAGWVARLLMRRERRALERLDANWPRDWACAPSEAPSSALDGPSAPSTTGTTALHVPRAFVASVLAEPTPQTLVRSFIPGVPLHEATALPRNFFERLEQLVAVLHACGVAHNDLHKEPNVLVTPEGLPALVDFQLASVHRPGSARLARRAAEDLRHIHKHRTRYEQRDGAKRSTRKERGWLANLWMATGKRIYNWLTRRVFKTRDGEGRRPAQGPWPEWIEPVDWPQV